MNYQNGDKSTSMYFNKLASKMSQQFGMKFGETKFNIDEDLRNQMVLSASSIVFNKDVNTARAEASAAGSTTLGVKSSYKTNLLDDLKKEFVARGQNAMGESDRTIPSQLWAVYGSTTLTSNKQLMLAALAPSVIKPIHNKLVKSIVVKGIEYRREVNDTNVIDENGKTYNYYDLMNSRHAWDNIHSGGQPTIFVGVEMESGKIKEPTKNGNLCAIYNRKHQATNGFKAIKNFTDFIAKGIEIVSINVSDTVIPVEYLATGDNTYSGQISTKIADIALRLTHPETGKTINVVGRVDANGDILLASDSNDVKEITFKFHIPSKGAQSPLKTINIKSQYKSVIRNKAVAGTSLNQRLQDMHKFVLDQDIVANFGENSVKLVNSQKDDKLFDYIEETERKLIQAEKTKALAANYIQDERVQNIKSAISYKYVDMTMAFPGYTDFLTGANSVLAKKMYDACNDLDKLLNPNKKSFSMYSSSSAAQWIKDANGKDTVSLNLVGEILSEGDTIGDISVGPYSLQKVKIGNLYDTTYIVTNKESSQMVEREILDNGGVKRKAISSKHTYRLIPQFEENLDSIMFLHGPEYVTNGVGDNEYDKDFVLYYETEFDIIKYVNAMATIDFVEAPLEAKEATIK